MRGEGVRALDDAHLPRGVWDCYAGERICSIMRATPRGNLRDAEKLRELWRAFRAGRQDALYLGKFGKAQRDWGYAPEYVEAIWRMLQQESADDYVLGTGEAHSVREFVEEAFQYAGLDWRKHVGCLSATCGRWK